MKRALSFIIIILAMALFVGCGGNKEAKDNKSSNTTSPATQQSKSANTVEAVATNKPSAPVAGKPAETTSGNQTIKIRKVSATSYLQEANQSYPPSNVIDGDIKTCWAEGAKGAGIMEGLAFDFDNIYTITGFNIWTGYQKSEELFKKNLRPLAVRVSAVNYEEFHNLRDTMGMQRVLLKRPVKTSHVLITIIEIVDGGTINDACISEISFF